MTVLIILGIIIAVIIFLLISSVHLEMSFEDQFFLSVKFLFIKFQILPFKEKKKKPSKQTKQKPIEKKQGVSTDKESKWKELLKERGLSGLLSLLTELAGLAVDSAKELFSYLIVQDFYLFVQVSEIDAAQTAVTYGKACSVVYPAVNVLVQATTCKKYEIHIFPDFNASHTIISLHAKAKIKLFFILKVGLKTLIRGINIMKT